MMKTAKASIENKNKRKRIPLGSFCGRWQPSHPHTHMHTQWGRESTSPHIREITATWSGTLSIMLGPLKPHRCPLTCPKIPPPSPKLSMWSFIRPQQETSKQNTSLGGNPLSLSRTWITLEIRVSYPDWTVRSSFCYYLLLKELNFNSKRWTHRSLSLSREEITSFGQPSCYYVMS